MGRRREGTDCERNAVIGYHRKYSKLGWVDCGLQTQMVEGGESRVLRGKRKAHH